MRSALTIAERQKLHREWGLLGLLALLWGSSYLFINVAVREIPPLTLVAVRVSGAALFLSTVMGLRRQSLPRDPMIWRALGIQALFSSVGAWTLLVWGQQYVDAGLASVLNSTAPIFVFLFTAILWRQERLAMRKLLGALLGILGVTLIVGIEALRGLGDEVPGQLACLAAAALYACAAIYGRRFASIGALATATGTMLWAAVIILPIALMVERPWLLRPSSVAILSALTLSLFCTGVALLLYFRLLNTLGSMGVASQAYLRAGVGVLLGMLFLGETLSAPVAFGLLAAIGGVALINWPARASSPPA